MIASHKKRYKPIYRPLLQKKGTKLNGEQAHLMEQLHQLD